MVKVILQRSTQDEAPNVFQEKKAQPDVRNAIADRSEASASPDLDDGAPVLVRRPTDIADARIWQGNPATKSLALRGTAVLLSLPAGAMTSEATPLGISNKSQYNFGTENRRMMKSRFRLSLSAA